MVCYVVWCVVWCVVWRVSIGSQDASGLSGLGAVAVLAVVCMTSSEAEEIPVSVRAAWDASECLYNTLVCLKVRLKGGWHSGALSQASRDSGPPDCFEFCEPS